MRHEDTDIAYVTRLVVIFKLMLYLEVVVQGRCSFLSSHVLAATFEVLASWLCFILWCTWHNALLTYSFSFRVLNAHHPLELNFYWLVSSCHFTLINFVLEEWHQLSFLSVVFIHWSLSIACCSVVFYWYFWLGFRVSPTTCKCPKL